MSLTICIIAFLNSYPLPFAIACIIFLGMLAASPQGLLDELIECDLYLRVSSVVFLPENEFGLCLRQFSYLGDAFSDEAVPLSGRAVFFVCDIEILRDHKDLASNFCIFPWHDARFLRLIYSEFGGDPLRRGRESSLPGEVVDDLLGHLGHDIRH